MPEVVLDTDDLLRRVIFTNPNYIRPDFTVTSLAFKPRRIAGVEEKGLSVDVLRLTTLERSIVDRFRYRLYSLKASYVRQIGLDCEYDPVEGNKAHALIVGEFKSSTPKKLSLGASRVQYPD
jgi:hypothetical protein